MITKVVKSYKNIFICTAYNDLKYILFLISKVSDEENLIIVSNVESLYEFVLTIRDETYDVISIKSKVKSIYNPLQWCEEFCELANLRAFSKRQNNAKIYTISMYFDITSLFLSCHLHKENQLLLITSDCLYGEFAPIPHTLYTLFCKAFYNIPLRNFSTSTITAIGLDERFVRKNVANYFINNEEDISNAIQNKISIPCENSFILFIISKYEENILDPLLLKGLIQFFEIKYSNSSIVIKGHPREGEAEVFKDFEVIRIDAKVPVEFIDTTLCEAIIGVSSVALAYFANQNIKVYSFVEGINDKSTVELYKKYLIEHSRNINFLIKSEIDTSSMQFNNFF